MKLTGCSTHRTRVTIHAELSRNGAEYQRAVPLDACMAPIVEALNAAGIETVGCCCGHGRTVPSVALRDGTELWWDRRGTLWQNVPARYAEPTVRGFDVVAIRPSATILDALGATGAPGRCLATQARRADR